MVSLAIADTSPPVLRNQPSEIVSLRDNALWFPHIIPESYLQLSETILGGFYNASFGFRPVCCLFRDDANPAVLSKVLVTSESHRTVALDWHYDTGGVRSLGSPHYSTTTTETHGYFIKRTTGEDKDRIVFLRNGEWRKLLVSNYPECLGSSGSKDSFLRPYSLILRDYDDEER
jgi:hypothetical protein